jgi:hypothetical protein
MQIFCFENNPVSNCFAPTWRYVFGEELTTHIDVDYLAELILSKEDEIKSSTMIKKINDGSCFDGGTGLGPQSLTSRSGQYNLLTWDDHEVKKLFNQIKKTYIEFYEHVGVGKRPSTFIQCWANVVNPGQHLNIHHHSFHEESYLGGHFCVQVEKSETLYINPIKKAYFEDEQYASPNVPGKLTIFQSVIPHGTTPHVGTKKRITIAFDIITEEQKNRLLHEWKDHNTIIPFDIQPD